MAAVYDYRCPCTLQSAAFIIREHKIISDEHEKEKSNVKSAEIINFLGKQCGLWVVAKRYHEKENDTDHPMLVNLQATAEIYSSQRENLMATVFIN